MPSLSAYGNSSLVKMIYMGDSGTGKTGSLASLVKAGYNLRILDLDANLQTLYEYLAKDDPALLEKVDYVTYVDNYKATAAGPMISGPPRAYVNALKALTQWPDGSTPAEWGPNTVLVIDSLSALSNAAFEWAKGMNPTSKDNRQHYAAAQQSLEKVFEMVKSENFNTNVIIISHIKYVEDMNGVRRGYVNSVGRALGPIIPRYFTTMVMAELVGAGKTAKRVIRTVPTNLVALKTPAPFRLSETYPLESGLAELFKELQHNTNPKEEKK